MELRLLRISIIATAVSLSLLAGCEDHAGETADEQLRRCAPGMDPRAVVVLGYMDRKQGGLEARWPRVAFAVGDGTLLLTAAHCVDDFEGASRRPASPDIVVASPYYGDVFDFEIVAVDKEADLAVLKAPWPAHPALALAGEQELRAATEILIVSRPMESEGKPYHLDGDLHTELLSVLTASGADPDEAIQLGQTRQVCPGWSGSAMVVPGGGKAVGVVSQLRERKVRRARIWRSKQSDALGPGISSICALLRRHGVQSAALAQPAAFGDIPDAEKAFSIIMNYFGSLFNGESPQALELAETLAELRPSSAQAHVLLGFAATYRAYTSDDGSSREWLDLARSSYEKAVRQDPNNAHVRAICGDFFLAAGQDREALAQTEEALAIDPNDRLALVNHVLLLARREPVRAAESANRLIAADPNNPYHWFYQSMALRHLGRLDDALQAAQRAVDLEPEGNFNGCLADVLAEQGHLDEAESQFALMTERCGCRQCWFRYAHFLLNHRTGKLAEAEAALDKAESKRQQGRIRQKDLDDLRRQLSEKASPDRAESLWRQRLEKDPNDAVCWWHLAGVLRTLGRFDEAVDAARQSVRLQPDSAFRPRLADCLARAGRLEEAQRTYDEMLSLHADRPRYWFWYAQFLHEHLPDRTEEAFTALEKAETATDGNWSVPAADILKLREELDARGALVP